MFVKNIFLHTKHLDLTPDLCTLTNTQKNIHARAHTHTHTSTHNLCMQTKSTNVHAGLFTSLKRQDAVAPVAEVPDVGGHAAGAVLPAEVGRTALLRPAAEVVLSETFVGSDSGCIH